MEQRGKEPRQVGIARLGLIGGSAAAFAVLASVGWVAPTAEIEACSATLTPSSVQVSAEPAAVRVELSESIGEVGSVMAHTDSGIEVGRYNDEMGSLMLDVAEANPGEWPITFHGEDDATCEGAITVTEEAAR